MKRKSKIRGTLEVMGNDILEELGKAPKEVTRNYTEIKEGAKEFAELPLYLGRVGKDFVRNYIDSQATTTVSKSHRRKPSFGSTTMLGEVSGIFASALTDTAIAAGTFVQLTGIADTWYTKTATALAGVKLASKFGTGFYDWAKSAYQRASKISSSNA